MSENRRYNVLVVCSTFHLAGREHLQGVLCELSNTSEWHIDIMRPDLFASGHPLVSETGEPYDGFIITMPGDDAMMARIATSRKPTVLVNIADRRLSARSDNIALVWLDNADISRKAAEHLLARGGFASTGFVHDQHLEFYSYERMSAFRQEMKRCGCRTAVFPADAGSVSCPKPVPWWSSGSREAAVRLREWLLEMPKPAAVMAANDMAAALVAGVCAKEGLGVPSDVAIVGVDHDVSMHAACGMSISSVSTNMADLGGSAVRELDYLFRHPGRKRRPHEVLVAAGNVIAGDTTAKSRAASRLLAEARRFIAENKTGRISSSDVAAHLGCSRKLVELRFSQMERTTVRKAIEDARMEEARRRLLDGETGRDIAKSMQFTSANQFYRVFKRHFGIPTRKCRNRYHAERGGAHVVKL